MEASIFEQLAAPIEKTNVKRKKITWTDKKTGEKKSYETDYITARTVMNRLDRVVGPDNWSDDYIDRQNGSVRCILSVRINGEWISKSDVGTETDIEGDKGAYSEAFKRAAVKWGIGRELYDEGTAYEPAPSKGNGASQSKPPQKAPQQPEKVEQTAPKTNQRPYAPERIAKNTYKLLAGKPKDEATKDEIRSISIKWNNILGQDDDTRHAVASFILNRTITTFNELYSAEVDRLKLWLADPPFARQEGQAIVNHLSAQLAMENERLCATGDMFGGDGPSEAYQNMTEATK